MSRWRRLRKFRRKHRQFWWQDFRWPFIGVLALFTFVAGSIGFLKYFTATGDPRSISDILYLTLQLFTIESGAVPGTIPWELEIARWLAPMIAAYTAVKALGVIFREQFQLIRLKFIKDHIIICGSGSKADLLAQNFYSNGYRVVKILENNHESVIDNHKDNGIIVFNGDARNERFLYRAGIHKAKYLILFCEDDGKNIEIAVQARKIIRDINDKTLTCIVHLVDPWLCQLLKEKEIGAEKVDSFRLEFFDIFNSGARYLLKEFPPFAEFEKNENLTPHILIIGLGLMGKSLLLHIAKYWNDLNEDNKMRFQITIIDKIADSKIESLDLQYPQLKKICDIIPLQLSIESIDFQRGDFLFNKEKKCTISSIFICLDDDSKGLSAALVLQNRLDKIRIPIVVRMARESGLATLLSEKSGNEGFASLQSFGLLDRTCESGLVLGGINETIARAVHEDYIDMELKKGNTLETNASMVPWVELPENLKESNRLVADNIILKLKAIGCGITPLSDWDAGTFVFKSDEIERMAEMEHNRWMSERLNAGWKYRAAKKNIKKKTSPYLVDWSDLPDEIKQIDRDIVMRIPKFLSKVDLQVYRQ